MIVLSEVGKRYPNGFEALKDISLTIGKGEMVFVTGHSGAGKSTLLKLIAGIEKPSNGTVVVNGMNLARLGARAAMALRRNIGLVFQDHKLLFDRNVFENVALPLYLDGYSEDDVQRRVNAALDKVELLRRAKAQPIALSSGEQQRLCIARAIVNRPALLLADEPTGNMDADYTRLIHTILRSFHQVGVTVVVATHDAARVAAEQARLVALNEGQLAA